MTARKKFERLELYYNEKHNSNNNNNNNFNVLKVYLI